MNNATSPPKISVVIPAYNEEKLIGKCLEALTQQTFSSEDYEIIVVDNASTDRTAEIVRSFIPNFSHLTLMHEPTRDISTVRNTGFKKARAEIIAGTDADTQVPVNWLMRIWSEFQKDKKLVGLTGICQYESKNMLFNTLFKTTMKIADNIHHLLVGSFPFRGTNFAVRKSIWARAGGFTPHFGALEDVDLSIRVGVLGKISYLPDLVITTTYRRFYGRFLKQLVIWTKAYSRHVIFKSDKRICWEPIR